MAGAPDLFVVCKHCGAEVSPYVTECPYCGHRLRKRAPNIERDAAGESHPKETRRSARGRRGTRPQRQPKPAREPRSGRSVPGLRGNEDGRPYVTIALVLFGAIGFLVLAFVSTATLGLVGPPEGRIWQLLLTPFVGVNAWTQLATLGAVALFGTLLERRHGGLLVLVLWLAAASGGAALEAAIHTFPVALGANGGALGLLAAWTVPVLLARRRDGDGGDADEADLYGVLVIAVVVALLAVSFAISALVAAWGLVVGGLTGLVLARVRPR